MFFFSFKPKSVLDELIAESTNIESDNIVQGYSKRSVQLQTLCFADYNRNQKIITENNSCLLCHGVMSKTNRLVLYKHIGHNKISQERHLKIKRNQQEQHTEELDLARQIIKAEEAEYKI